MNYLISENCAGVIELGFLYANASAMRLSRFETAPQNRDIMVAGNWYQLVKSVSW